MTSDKEPTAAPARTLRHISRIIATGDPGTSEVILDDGSSLTGLTFVESSVRPRNLTSFRIEGFLV